MTMSESFTGHQASMASSDCEIGLINIFLVIAPIRLLLVSHQLFKVPIIAHSVSVINGNVCAGSVDDKLQPDKYSPVETS